MERLTAAESGGCDRGYCTLNRFLYIGIIFTVTATGLIAIGGWFILVGVAMMLTGSLIGVYGSYTAGKTQSKETIQELDSRFRLFDEKISEAMALPAAERKQEVEHISEEFNLWAIDFLKNRDRRKLEYEKTRLKTAERNIELDEASWVLFSQVLESLKSMLSAYKKVGVSEHICWSIPDLPHNLIACSTDINDAILGRSRNKATYTAWVKFSPKVDWNCGIISSHSDFMSRMLCFNRNVHNGSSQRKTLLWIFPCLSKQTFQISTSIPELRDAIEGEYQLGNAKDTLHMLVRTMLEFELAQQ